MRSMLHQTSTMRYSLLKAACLLLTVPLHPAHACAALPAQTSTSLPLSMPKTTIIQQSAATTMLYSNMVMAIQPTGPAVQLYCTAGAQQGTPRSLGLHARRTYNSRLGASGTSQPCGVKHALSQQNKFKHSVSPGKTNTWQQLHYHIQLSGL